MAEVIYMGVSSISVILKQRRNLLGFTPEQVVSKLEERGLSISAKALYAYESGTNLPKVPVFMALCDIYEIRDIMGSFGYTTVPLCTNDTEWESDQYEDFFKCNLHEKVMLLKMWGIPSFSEYEEFMNQPGQFALTNDETRFVRLYRQLDERNRDAAFSVLEGLLAAQPGEKASPAPKEA